LTEAHTLPLQTRIVRVTVEPGICGLPCRIHARRESHWSVELAMQSDCQKMQRLAGHLKGITMRELLSPVSGNPIFRLAEQEGCHPSCPVPVAIAKAAEVALELALPKEVTIRFEP
jgi:hypothetical protein